MAGDSPDGKGSTCLNSYYGSLPERIVKLLDDSEIELTPKQIAEKLHANRSTVRVYLPQLVAQNRIVTPYRGAYSSKTTYMVGAGALRVHNIVATADVDVDEHFDVTEQVGAVKVRVVFGEKRGKVTVFISCDAGMDRNSCLLALDKGFGIVKARLGKDLEHICLKTFELNRDFLGVRVDRATCVTRVGLYNMVERIYQKSEGVRHEWKVSREMPLAEFEALLQGGVTSYNLMQANFALVKEVQKLTDAQKMTNDLLGQYGRVLDALMQRIYRDNDERSAKEEGRPPPDVK